MAAAACSARARGSPPLSSMEKGRRCYRASARAFAFATRMFGWVGRAVEAHMHTTASVVLERCIPCCRCEHEPPPPAAPGLVTRRDDQARASCNRAVQRRSADQRHAFGHMRCQEGWVGGAVTAHMHTNASVALEAIQADHRHAFGHMRCQEGWVGGAVTAHMHTNASVALEACTAWGRCARQAQLATWPASAIQADQRHACGRTRCQEQLSRQRGGVARLFGAASHPDGALSIAQRAPGEFTGAPIAHPAIYTFFAPARMPRSRNQVCTRKLRLLAIASIRAHRPAGP